jgi:hypothetical protein
MFEKANETFGTDAYNIRGHCNMCNITIYFYNIYMRHLQHTSETIETYSYNMHFQHNISLLLDGMEARRCVVFTEGSGLTTLVGGVPMAVAACRRKGGIGRTSGGEAAAA